MNFKNVASAAPVFSAGLNCLVGENGAGKTNILDALHYLSAGRGALGGSDRGAVRHGEEFFVIEGDFTRDDGSRFDVSCSFSAPVGKRLKADGKEYERLSDHVGVVPVVMVSPSDSALVSDSADERRRWLNGFISGLDRDYLSSLMRYNAVMAERNRLLRDGGSFGGGDSEILDVLDMQLSQHGQRIHSRRAEIVALMQPLVAQYYAHLSGDREQVEMSYRSEPSLAPREKDLTIGFTSSGVHRDDISMRIGGHPLRRYGSQGQQKSFLVALKLAQFVVLRNSLTETPLLLLDDLFDKLDTGRVERLLELVSELVGGEAADPRTGPETGPGQIFISDCNRSRLEEVLRRGGRPYSLFELQNGTLLTAPSL